LAINLDDGLIISLLKIRLILENSRDYIKITNNTIKHESAADLIDSLDNAIQVISDYIVPGYTNSINRLNVLVAELKQQMFSEIDYYEQRERYIATYIGEITRVVIDMLNCVTKEDNVTNTIEFNVPKEIVQRAKEIISSVEIVIVNRS